MQKYLLALFLIIVCFTKGYGLSTYAPGDSIGEKMIKGQKYILYQVSQGETLYRLATQHHVTVAELIEANPELEDGLKSGQVLFIPYRKEPLISSAPKPASVPQPATVPSSTAKLPTEVGEDNLQTMPDGSLVHIVQAGETFYGLSRKYGVSIEELKQMNTPELKIGQELLIKPAATAEAPASKEPERVVESKAGDASPKPAQQAVVAAPVESKAAAPTENKPLTIVETATPAAVAPPKQAPAKPVAAAPQQEERKPIILRSDPQQITHDSIKIHNSISYLDDRDDLITGTKRVLVVPFDPYMYFSDADEEIAARSKMPRHKVREVFRRRLNVLIDPKGYEAIYLLGATEKDSLQDLQRIYSSVSYNYENIVYKGGTREKEARGENGIEIGAPPEQTWLEKKKKKFITAQNTTRAKVAKDQGKYFGATINDPKVIDYFNNKYGIEYYIFVNQFEVKTNYEHCLDRAAQDYERNFLTHFSIFDRTGKLVVGNKVKIYYNSNSNSIFQIVNDNMQKIADAILAELPR